MRAQTAAATAAVNARLRTDETRLRKPQSSDMLGHLLELIKKERAARAQQEEAARKASVMTIDPSGQPDDGGEDADASVSEKK